MEVVTQVAAFHNMHTHNTHARHRPGDCQSAQGQPCRPGAELSPCQQRVASAQALPGPAADSCHRETPGAAGNAV